VTPPAKSQPILVLASASPRRRELLGRLGVPFAVKPVGIDEDPGRNPNPQVIASRLARMKAEAARLLDQQSPLIAADTVVAIDGEMLGKPRDAEDARTMLRRLRAREHLVVTGIAVMRAGGRASLVRQPITRVVMRDYSEADIEATIARGDPFDKAGGYAIQDEAFLPVAHYRGCYCNVIGLSLWATIELLRKADICKQPDISRLLPQCAACPLRPPG